jgi:hypothetical protein
MEVLKFKVVSGIEFSLLSLFSELVHLIAQDLGIFPQ